MSQETIFQFLQRKEAVSRSARKLLSESIEAGCHGVALKFLSSFIEEIDNEINALGKETSNLYSTNYSVNLDPAIYWEELIQRDRQGNLTKNKDPVTAPDPYFNQDE